MTLLSNSSDFLIMISQVKSIYYGHLGWVLARTNFYSRKFDVVREELTGMLLNHPPALFRWEVDYSGYIYPSIYLPTSAVFTPPHCHWRVNQIIFLCFNPKLEFYPPPPHTHSPLSHVNVMQCRNIKMCKQIDL